MCTHEWVEDPDDHDNGEYHQWHGCKLDGDHANEDHVCWCGATSNAYCVLEYDVVSREYLRAHYGSQVDLSLPVFNENQRCFPGWGDFGAIPYICDYTWSTGEAGETYQCTLIHDPREKNVLHYDETAGLHAPEQLEGLYRALKINAYLPLSGVMFDDNLIGASSFPEPPGGRYIHPRPKPWKRSRVRELRERIKSIRIVDIRDYHHSDDCDW